jgi:hypothetical protein
MNYSVSRATLLAVGILVFPLICSAATVSWVGGSGDWNTAGNWDTGVLPGPDDDVLIDTAGVITVTHSSGTHAVKSIQSHENFVLSGGSLRVSNNFEVWGGLALSGGTLIGATVVQGVNENTVAVTGTSVVLDGVTVNGTIEVGLSINGAQLILTNGLVLNGALRVGNPTNQWYGVVHFEGSQALAGYGTVTFGDHPVYNSLRLNLPSTTLTLGPDLTVRGHSGVIGYNSAWGGSANVSVINQGTISADTSGDASLGTIRVAGQSFVNAGVAEARNGGTLDLPANVLFNSGLLNAATSGALRLGGVWTNAGTLNMTNAAVYLGGSFTVSNLGLFNRDGGSVYVTGTLNNTGTELALNGGTGSWVMLGGTIRGGTISGTGGARLIFGNPGGGTLDGTTCNGDLDLESINGAQMTMTNGLVLNGTLRVGNPTNQWYAVVVVQGSQTLSGNATVVFGNHSSYNALLLTLANTTLTLGSGVTVRGHTGVIGYNSGWGGPANVNVINQGTILAETTGGTIRVAGQSFVNAGVAEARNGGTLDLPANVLFNSGLLNAATGGALRLGGVWTNAGTLSMTNAAVYLGGNFTISSLGVFNRDGGTVYVTGTLNNTNTELTLNGGTGSWVMLGGTIRAGTVSVTGGARLIFSNIGGGTLDGTTCNGDLDLESMNGAQLTMTNGLVLNGTLRVGNPTNQWYAVVVVQGSQTLSGNATVVFGNHSSYNALLLTLADTTLTLGSGVTIRGHSGIIGYSSAWGGPANVSVINQGVILADTSGGTIRVAGQSFVNAGLAEARNGGTLDLPPNVLVNNGVLNAGSSSALRLAGEWTNAGTINMTHATVYLGGSFSVSDLGLFNRDGGTVYVTGTLNNTGTELALNADTGSWVMLGGTIRGGTVSGAGGAELIFSSIGGTLDGTTCNGDLDLESINAAALTLTNGVVLNGTLRVGNPTNQWYGVVNFNGSQTLGGNGTVIFGNHAAYNALRLTLPNTTLTVGPGVTVRGHTGVIGYASAWGGPANVSVINQGVISGDVNGGTLYVVGQSVTNEGSVGQTGGGRLRLQGAVVNAGQISPGTAPGIVEITGSFTQSASGVLNVTMGGLTPGSNFSQLNISGAAILDGTVAVTLVNGFLPALSNEFAVVGCSSRTGVFSGLAGDGPRFMPTYRTNGVTLLAMQVPPGTPAILVNGRPISGSVTRTNIATIELQTSFPNGVIFFTLDGSSPQNGQLYTAPFFINESAVIRAVAYTANFASSAESGPVTVQIVYTPAIVASPQGQVVAAGSSAQFQVVAAGSAPLTYQWRKNGIAIPGAAGSSLNLANVQPSHAGNYSVIVSNPYGSVASAAANLTVIQPPMVESQPASASVALQSSVMFCVSVSGDPLLRFQWRKNGVNIPNATNQCFTIEHVQVADGGNYSVVIENDIGAVVSAPAQLTVLLPQVTGGDAFTNRITISQNCFSGTNFGATSQPGEPRHAGKPGGRSIWYRWFAPTNGIAIFETTGSSFDTLLAVYTGSDVAALAPIASDEDNGGFLNSRVRFNAVTNVEYLIAVDGYAGAQGTFAICWRLEPAPALLPVIMTQPVSQTVLLNGMATFSVVATSTAPGLSFQWFFNNAPLPGKTNAFLNLTTVLPEHVGLYKVAVSNSFVGLFSDNAILEIGPVAGVQSVDKLPDLSVPPPGFAPGGTRAATLSTSIGISVSAGSINSQIINNTDSATSPTEPLPCHVLGGASRWLVLQPSATATLRIDTIGSTVDTILSVFTGSNPLSIVPLPDGCDDNGAGDGARSLLRFTAQAGTNYYVHADTKGGTNGIIFINWGLGVAPTTSQTQTRHLVRQGDSLMLGSTAMGIPEPVFQWRRDNATIPNATNRFLSLTNIQPADGGAYSVVASNFIGAILHPVALVTVQSNAFAAAQDFFDSSHLAWTASSNATIVYETAGGNPGGYLSMRGEPATSSHLAAPDQYLGDKFYLYGGLLSFDLRRPAFADVDIVLHGGGRALVFSVPGTEQTNWNSYNLLLHESAGWHRDVLAGPVTTREEFLGVLTSLDDLLIQAAVLPIDIDNLEFLAPTTPVLALRADTDAWLIQWPSAIGSYGVEATSTFAADVWAPISASPVTSEGLNSIRVLPSMGPQFFRLRKLSP